MEIRYINTTIGGVQIPVYYGDFGIATTDRGMDSYTSASAVPSALVDLINNNDGGLQDIVNSVDLSTSDLISSALPVISGGEWYLLVNVEHTTEQTIIQHGFSQNNLTFNAKNRPAGGMSSRYTTKSTNRTQFYIVNQGGKWFFVRSPESSSRISNTAPVYVYGGEWKSTTYPVTVDSMMNNVAVTEATSGGGAGGPTSGPGGGGGNFDNTSDTISAPSGNIKGLVDSGMLGIFAPSEAQLKEFAGFIWSDNIFDQIKKYNDPLDMIISLTQIPTTPPISGNGVVKIGNVLLSETFTLPYVSNQFFEFDMGEITIPEYWGNFLDYSPYTNVQIYLPYIGFREISTDDVMGGTIKLKYVIDCISGTCLGILEVVKKDFDAVLYQWTGNCSMEIPLTGRRTKVDFSSLFSILGTAAGGAAIGGAAGAAVSAGLGAVNAISQSATKPIISRSGNISSNGGFAGVQTPYIVISRKIQSLPDKYQTFDGYPSNISAKLSSLKGFVKVSKIHLDGIPCTESELDEINEYLTGGIII